MVPWSREISGHRDHNFMLLSRPWDDDFIKSIRHLDHETEILKIKQDTDADTNNDNNIIIPTDKGTGSLNMPSVSVAA